MNCKLIRLERPYKDKKGAERIGADYYLSFDNGEVISICPRWTKNADGTPNQTDWIRLRAFSTKEEHK